jgi:hypothetical protein
MVTPGYWFSGEFQMNPETETVSAASKRTPWVQWARVQ